MNRKLSEDWLALWLGLFIFVLSLGVFSGVDLLGWGVKTNVWIDAGKALAPFSKRYAALSGIGALFATFAFMAAVMAVCAKILGASVKKFLAGFTLIFWISYGCWLVGNNAYIAATTRPEMQKFGIGWALKLTGEAGFIVALIAGLVVGNFFPRLAASLKEATRPELYIKAAIVILGGGLGVVAAEQLGLATAVMFRGLCAIVEAYLIYWAVVYFISRRYFRFSREWAAPLASGVSICGVSAAIATGGAIRARPVVPIMVSSLVVIFAVVELLALPLLARNALYHEPMVAGAWMGLAVKTDGAAVASGAIADSLIRGRAAEEGVNYQPDWIMGATATVKIFIDIFIGVWAFILAIIWATFIDRKPGDEVRAKEIWDRCPKFVLGYIATFLLILFIALHAPKETMAAAKAATGEANVFRGLFFVMTFFTIGVVSNFKKLWEEGIGKLAAVYVISLFGFIIWVGLLISWIFFHGVKPPLAS
ncbi:MAG TPA: putative sulfate exporter family transporter [Myxococcales bacterium]